MANPFADERLRFAALCQGDNGPVRELQVEAVPGVQAWGGRASSLNRTFHF